MCAQIFFPIYHYQIYAYLAFVSSLIKKLTVHAQKYFSGLYLLSTGCQNRKAFISNTRNCRTLIHHLSSECPQMSLSNFGGHFSASLRFDSLMLTAVAVTAPAEAVGDSGPLSPGLTNQRHQAEF